MSRSFLSHLVLVLLLAVVVCAQQFTPVQQVPAHLDAAAQVSTLATSATALTLTPNGSENVVVYEVDVQNCTNATGVAPAAQTNITTTNLSGSPIWQMGSGSNNATLWSLGNCAQTFSVNYPTGLKGNAPGPVTFTLPTFAAQQTIRLNVAWRSAPTQ